MRRLWREHFFANPLLWREAGLWEGRPRWRAPLVIALTLAALVIVIDLACFGLTWGALAHVRLADHGQNVSFFRAGQAANQVWLRTLFVPAALGALVLPVWFTARAWARESEESPRAHLATSLLSLRQLIGAKTLLWLTPGLAVVAGLCSAQILKGVAVLNWAERDSYLWIDQLGLAWADRGLNTLGDLYLGLSRMLWQDLLKSVLPTLLLIPASLVALGMATRLTLLGLSPLVAAGVATVLSVGLLCASLFTANWLREDVLGWFTETSTIMIVLVPGVTLVVTAWAIWRGLPRQVARVYGMER